MKIRRFQMFHDLAGDAPPAPPAPAGPPAPPPASPAGGDIGALLSQVVTMLASGQQQSAASTQVLADLRKAHEAAQAEAAAHARAADDARAELARVQTASRVARIQAATGADPRVVASVILPALGDKADDAEALKAFAADPANATLLGLPVDHTRTQPRVTGPRGAEPATLADFYKARAADSGGTQQSRLRAKSRLALISGEASEGVL